MKSVTSFLARSAACASLFALPAMSQQTNDAVLEKTDWSYDFGADLRVRQEMMDNIPGNPGGAYSVLPAKRSGNKNQIRIRPRVWFELEGGPFRLYSRIADEFREYPVKNGIKRDKRAYTFPDEVFLDNLYLEGRGLEADWLQATGISSLDFRFGRQDLLEGGHSIFGLDRIIAEGTPYDGSRNFFSDMIRSTLHFDETRKLDVFALYCNGRNDIRWGNRQSDGRSLNPICMSDSTDLDEWGGGAVYSESALDGALPFKLYSIFKRSESYTSKSPVERKMPAKEITTLGFLLEPKFDEYWGMEFEGAKQFGRTLNGNRQAGGWMAHGGINYRPSFLKEFDPVLSWTTTYYSGDANRTEADDNDTAWDPMWARYTQDSEMLVYGALYGNCYWSNMIYSKLKLTMRFGKRHSLYAYTGPMFAAVQDNLGAADGDGDSLYKGWLSAARYDFPIKLAPKGANGFDRFEIFAHVVAESFQPGDYYDSSKPAYFIRWEVSFKF